MENKNEIISICGCGRPLIAINGEDGKRIGVTHQTTEDEEYHSNYFRSLVAIETNSDPYLIWLNEELDRRSNCC